MLLLLLPLLLVTGIAAAGTAAPKLNALGAFDDIGGSLALLLLLPLLLVAGTAAAAKPKPNALGAFDAIGG